MNNIRTRAELSKFPFKYNEWQKIIKTIVFPKMVIKIFGGLDKDDEHLLVKQVHNITDRISIMILINKRIAKEKNHAKYI